MKYKDFRNYKIVRNCQKTFNDYHSYIYNLSEDFNHRCAYCNMSDRIISQGFAIDHFIPMAAFKDTEKQSLENDYNNLIYSCPKCNNTKRDQYDGNLEDDTYENNLFYNPVDVDYNNIFYRNEYGGISSEDIKGKEMIVNLRLYSPIYNLSFLIEEIDNLLEKINNKAEKCQDADLRKYYNEVHRKLYNYLRLLFILFNCNYYNNSIKK